MTELVDESAADTLLSLLAASDPGTQKIASSRWRHAPAPTRGRNRGASSAALR